MKRTLVFHYRKSSFAKSMEWAMQEFQLAGSYLLPCFVMRFATSDGTEQPFGCTRVTIANMRHCILTSYSSTNRLFCRKMMVETNNSWLICPIYKKRQRSLHSIIPHPLVMEGKSPSFFLPLAMHACLIAGQFPLLSRRGAVSLSMSRTTSRMVVAIAVTNQRKQLS
uniref:NAC domain-containing protein n=1 Tax=Oryza meridionalis TaxID=40149 RepID=A0A0E0F618_9ORYZ